MENLFPSRRRYMVLSSSLDIFLEGFQPYLHLGCYTVTSKGLGGRGVLLDFEDANNVYARTAQDPRYGIGYKIVCIKAEYQDLLETILCTFAGKYLDLESKKDTDMDLLLEKSVLECSISRMVKEETFATSDPQPSGNLLKLRAIPWYLSFTPDPLAKKS
jgi:hypothetical protein